MDLYIANCTQQVQMFNYRPLGSMQQQFRQIGIGQQVKLGSPTWGTADIDHIIAQHTIYGMVRVDEIDRTRHFAGLCYDVDRPVPVAKVMHTIETNQQVLTRRGEEQRADAAVMVNHGMEKALGDIGAEVTATHVEVAEFEPSREARGRGAVDPQLSETITVDRRADAPLERTGRPKPARGPRPASSAATAAPKGRGGKKMG